MEEVKYNKDGSIAKKRGRPKKIVISEEIDAVASAIQRQNHQEFEEIVKQEREKLKEKQEWDIKKDDRIDFFDTNLSYEITGYKPINKTQGLDFNPNWFTEARETFIRTGHYTEHRQGTKAYADFWTEEYRRCKDGMCVNGYTITGDHYFFLNYYQLLDVTKVQKAGSGRTMNFPAFSVAQYEYLHYVDLCRYAGKHSCLMKARALGFSELNASLSARLYTVIQNSRTLIAAKADGKLTPTLNKTWGALSFLDNNTDGGMASLRQAKNDQYEKKSSHYITDNNGMKVEVGWMSSIRGVVADSPDKIRGDRAELIILEEAGSWAGLMKAVMQAEALINVGGQQIGSILFGGTGGDSGHALDDLRKLYYDPQKYNILPYRHRYTADHSEVLTGYFLPAYSLVLAPGFLDSRGWCDPEKGKQFYQQKRDALAGDPQGLLIYAAEHCFTAEEAFALEGDNKFNKIIIAEQLTRIRALKQCPNIETGYFNFTYKSGQPHRVDGRFVADVVWKEDANLGHVKILEKPAWLLPEQRDPDTNELLREAIPMQNAMYVAGVDGIDIGAAQTSSETRDPSDFCIVIYKRIYGLQDPQVVAYYKDRPQDLREAYQQAIALAMYYNAYINIEATRMSFCSWAKSVSLLNWFMKRPKATYQDITKVKSTAYGTPATNMVIEHQTDLIANFVEDYGYNLWFEELLVELNLYSDENKRKFDMVAALAMALLADEELNGVVPRPLQQQEMHTLNKIGYYIDDNGYKKFGIIPDQINTQLTYNPNYYDQGGIQSSNPRVLFGGVW